MDLGQHGVELGLIRAYTENCDNRSTLGGPFVAYRHSLELICPVGLQIALKSYLIQSIVHWVYSSPVRIHCSVPVPGSAGIRPFAKGATVRHLRLTSCSEPGKGLAFRFEELASQPDIGGSSFE